MITKPIIITNDGKGIADSHFTGFRSFLNCDIETLGQVKINYKSTLDSGAIVTDLVKWFAINPISGRIYAYGDSNKVYQKVGGVWSVITGNTSPGLGKGFIYWKDHLFVMGNSNIDVYGPISGTPVWTNNWKTGLQVDDHFTLIGQDDIMYIANGRFVATIAGFVAGSPPTATLTTQALDLPQDYRIKTIVELGKNILLGTWRGVNITEQKIADIFPWDRNSSTFFSPIRLNENGINQMININNIVYVVAGTQHNIYKTDGVNIRKIKRLPLELIDFTGGQWVDPQPAAIMNHEGKLFTGISIGGGSMNPLGVWSLKNETTLNFENQISTGNTGTSLWIGALISISPGVYLASWRDGQSFGVDSIGHSNRYTTGASFESKFYQVGTKRKPETLEHFEIHLDRPLTSGLGVILSYRLNLSDTYTQITNFNFATAGAKSSIFITKAIPDVEKIQFKVQLESGGSTTTPRITNIIIQ